MLERTIATQFARLLAATALTAVVIGASWWQLVSSSHEAATPSIVRTLSLD